MNLGTVCLFLTLKWGLTIQISMKETEGTVLFISANISMSFSKSTGPNLFSKHGLIIINTVTVEENPWGQTAVCGLMKGERIRPGLNSTWKLGHLSKNIPSCFSRGPLFGYSRDRMAYNNVALRTNNRQVIAVTLSLSWCVTHTQVNTQVNSIRWLPWQKQRRSC